MKKLEAEMRSHALIDARVDTEIATDRLAKALEAVEVLAEWESDLATSIKQTELALARLRKLSAELREMEATAP